MNAADKIKAIANSGKEEPPSDVAMILYREPYIENDTVMYREHGPMPVSEWAVYEKENGL